MKSPLASARFPIASRAARGERRRQVWPVRRSKARLPAATKINQLRADYLLIRDGETSTQLDGRGSRIDFAPNSLILPCYGELTPLFSRINSLFCRAGNSQAGVSPKCHRFLFWLTDCWRRRGANLNQGRDGYPRRNRGIASSQGPPDRGARGFGGRVSAPTGAGQHEQLEAAFERRVEEEAARAPQSARQVGQGERRPGGPRGRYSAAGRPTRFRGSARGVRVPALPFAARSEGADRDREAPGVRSSRAPAAGDGASGFGLPLRALPARDQGGVSRRRGLAGAIWRALQGGGGLSERPAVDPRGSDRADDERHIRRASGLFGERRRLGGREGGRADAGLRADRRARRRREGSPSRRDGLSDRRQAAMAAHDFEPLLHLLSRRRKARRHSQEFERRRRRSRPLQALQRARRGHPRLLQRPYPARTRGPDRV